jgi:atlastin
MKIFQQYKSINNPNNTLVNTSSWIGASDEPLKGFSWKSGPQRHTNGIVIWSDVFLYADANNTKYAVILMDTQGLFDTKTPTAENSKIFAISSLLSSLLIFNLNAVMQEDQLQYLQVKII